MVTQMLSSSHSKTHSLPLLPIRYNSFGFDRTATCVFGNCAKRRSFRFASTSSVVRGAKVVRERGERMRLREWGREGEGEMETGLFGPLRPAWAGQLREKFPLLLPTQTGMTHVAAIHRCPNRDRRTRGRADGRTDARCRHPPLPLPTVAVAAYRTHCVSHALLSARMHLRSASPVISFAFHGSSETGVTMRQRFPALRLRELNWQHSEILMETNAYFC